MLSVALVAFASASALELLTTLDLIPFLLQALWHAKMAGHMIVIANHGQAHHARVHINLLVSAYSQTASIE